MSVILTSKDISKKLKIGKSLVREISKQLEKEAYQFTKNQNTRIYSEKDFTLIQTVLENYNKHQNLPLAVQYGLEIYQQNAEETYEEVPLLQPSNVVAIHIKTDSNYNDHSGQIDDSIYTKEVDNKNENSLNNIDTVNPIVQTLHNVKVDVDHIEAIPNVVDSTIQHEVLSSSLDNAVQNGVTSNHIQTLDHIEPPSNLDKIVVGIEVSSTREEVVEEIVSKSSSNEEVDNQISSINLAEQEQPQHDLIQNSIEKVDLSSDDINEAIHNEASEHSHHALFNKTDIHQIEMQANSHKLTKINEEPNSNQVMFEEFMSQISNLATQNELILQQNQTLIQQNLLKDQKLEKILHSVEEKSDELQELASVIEEKDEKLEQMFEEIQVREVSRDAQLMRVIREMQETKKMVAASKEKDWKSSLKSFFIKPKAIK